MKTKLYSVYDSKVEAYQRPFHALTKGQAIRDITQAVNDEKDHPYHKHSQDFTLFEVGEYDDSTGLFDPYQAPVSVGNLLEFKQAEPQLPLPLRGH